MFSICSNLFCCNCYKLVLSDIGIILSLDLSDIGIILSLDLSDIGIILSLDLRDIGIILLLQTRPERYWYYPITIHNCQ